MLGGLGGADTTCGQVAAAAGLPGEFVALLSTSSVNAVDRLAGSRGWIRSDGAPIADVPGDLFINGRMLNPLDHVADGTRLSDGAGLNTWTGADDNGFFDPVFGSCGDWDSLAGSGAIGLFDRSAPYEIATSGGQPCASPGHLYCFEIGHAFAVQTTVANGRIAFLGTATGSIGVAALNAQCQTDATMAGLAGTYLAAVATTTSSIASSFMPGAPWRRVDGTQVSASDTAMFDGTDLVSFINQAADGTYLAGQFTPNTKTGATSGTAVGTSQSTCADWTSTTGLGAGGSPIDTSSGSFWGGTSADCSLTYPTVCLEQ